jgi:hypothetical protein
MKKISALFLVGGLALLLGANSGLFAAAGSEGGWTPADQEYYLPENVIFYFRPGLEFELDMFEIPDDGQPYAEFTITDPTGRPLDMDGVTTPGPVEVRWMLSYIPAGEEQVVNYHPDTRGRDSGGTYTSLGPGKYSYKFGTVLPDDYEVDSTHTLNISSRRVFSGPEFANLGLDTRYYDNDVMNFVPSGASEPMPRDIVTTATCNRCHGELAFHGGNYREVQMCQNCHNPEYMGARDAPERALNVMIHEVHSSNLVEDGEVLEVHYPAIINDCEVCHTGGTPTADFPLVADPNPVESCDGLGKGMTTISWGDEGAVEIRLDSIDGKLFGTANADGSADTGNWVTDGREFYLVSADSGAELGDVSVGTSVFGCADNPPGTFRGEAGALHTNWLTRPQRGACGGCHVDIDWETGEGHAGGAQDDDDLCAQCHRSVMGAEFDRSIPGAHTVIYKSSQLGGILVTVLNITDVGPGMKPTVTFSLTDKDGPLNPAVLNRLRFALAGPNEDFDFYVQEDVHDDLVATESGANWMYTFGVEGRIEVMLEGLEGEDAEQEDQMQNFTTAIAVTDSMAMPRDMIVDDAKCENCHSNLSLHGDNRNNANGYCQTCHRADVTDERVRLEGDPESVHFKYMIHKLHMGEDLENGYVVYGYRSSVHDFSHVGFPGELSNCLNCHAGDPDDDEYEPTFTLPLPEGRLPTVSPNTLINPMMPATAACLSCHDSDAAASHAAGNTSDLGESCDVCHGEGRTYSVERVHAR